MYRLFGYIAILGSLFPACRAQGLVDEVTSVGTENQGAGLYQLGVFAGYSTSANPYGALGQYAPGVASLGADENYGANAILGWQRHGERSSFSARYSGTYQGMAHYSSANGYSQSLTLGGNRQMSEKWSVSLRASGADNTVIQLLNEPTAVSVTSQLPSNFDDFAASFGIGSFSTPQVASSIQSAPVLQTPLSALLLGGQVLTYSGSLGLDYAASPHLTFHVSPVVEGGQDLSSSQSGFANYLMPFSYGGNAGMTWSYSTSPRTQIGFNLQGMDTQNRYQGSYGGTATASLGRKMGTSWFLRMYGGATLMWISEQFVGAPQTHNIVGGGSLGVKTYTGTFVASYGRSEADSYGFLGTSTTASGSWSQHHPGSSWSTSATFSQQQLRNTGFESLSGWQASAGLSKRLTEHIEMRGQYVYLSNSGSYLGSAARYSVQSVRLTMSWLPHPDQRR